MPEASVGFAVMASMVMVIFGTLWFGRVVQWVLRWFLDAFGRI